jgi:hypothetical protein
VAAQGERCTPAGSSLSCSFLVLPEWSRSKVIKVIMVVGLILVLAGGATGLVVRRAFADASVSL